MNRTRRSRWTEALIPFASLFILSALLLSLNGCGSSYPAPGVDGLKYHYLYTLTEPALSPKMQYKDDHVSFTFTIDDAAIHYSVLNLSTKLVTVESGAAMLGIDSVYSPVRNSISFYSDTANACASLTLPPRGSLEDHLIPRDNVYWNEEGWGETDLFSTLDSGTVSGKKEVMQNVGRTVDLLLPVKYGERRTMYQFRFKVSAVRVVPEEAVVPAKRRPKAPKMYGWSGE